MISIIVPVYNSELYLQKCLDSIQAQSYQDYEVILVDDGSTDHSLDICQYYSQKDSRIYVFHQKNGGSTKARKAGLAMAKGEYISFVDSDDWLAPCYLEIMYKLIDTKHADIVASGCVVEEPGKAWNQLNQFEEGSYTGNQLREVIYPQMLYYDKNGFFSFGILQYLWGKLFKRSIIERCVNDLDERIYDGEDVACIYDACLKASSIVIDNHSYYHYRIHESSVCASIKDEKYFANAVYLYKYMMKVFQNSNESEIMILQLKYFISMFINSGMMSAFGCGYQKSYPASVWRLPDIPEDKKYRMAIFGAGSMGLSYYKQLLDNNNIEITIWVDSNIYGKKIGGVYIEPPEVLKDTEWDYILVAVRNVADRKEVLNVLIKMGIAETKIFYRDAERYYRLYDFVPQVEKNV